MSHPKKYIEKVSGFNSANHKVGDNVIFVCKTYEGKIYRLKAKINRITPTKRVRVKLCLENNLPKESCFDFDFSSFYQNGDLIGDIFLCSYWLEEAPTEENTKNLVSHLQSHPNWYKVSEADLLTIHSILAKYGN